MHIYTSYQRNQHQSHITNVSTTTLPWLHHNTSNRDYGDDQNHNRDNGDDHNHNHNSGNNNGYYGWEDYVGRARASDVSALLALRYVVFLFFLIIYVLTTNYSYIYHIWDHWITQLPQTEIRRQGLVTQTRRKPQVSFFSFFLSIIHVLMNITTT